MSETVTFTLHSSPLHNNGQHLSLTSEFITIYLIYQQRNAWIFNKQEDKKMHVRKVPEVRLLSPVLRLACNLRAASVDEGKEKTRLIDASEEHYANCWLISPGQLSVIWTVLGGRPEDKTGRDFTSVWCNQSALFTKLEAFFLLWRIKISSLKSTALCLWFPLKIPWLRTSIWWEKIRPNVRIDKKKEWYETACWAWC